MSESAEITVILGASPHKERYSYLAMKTLEQKGLPFVLVNPSYSQIEDNPVVGSLKEVGTSVHTVSIYLSPQRQAEIMEDLVKLRPKRVIFNPGSESVGNREVLESQGISCLEACTLVLLKTGQFYPHPFEFNKITE